MKNILHPFYIPIPAIYKNVQTQKVLLEFSQKILERLSVHEKLKIKHFNVYILWNKQGY